MKKTLIFIVLIGGIAMFEPRSRDGILSLFPALRSVTQRRSAERTVTQIALEIQATATQTGAYPPPAGFAEWVERTQRAHRDPWGADYYLELYPDSFVVGSPGPDSRRRTGDDVRLARLRGPNAERLRPGYSPPAPPASGVKASAIRNAQEATRQPKH